MKLRDVDQANAKISIYDLLGRTIQTSQSFVSGNLLEQIINMPDHTPNGLYLVKVIVEGRNYSASLIYNK